jgi:hypothetical protein
LTGLFSLYDIIYLTSIDEFASLKSHNFVRFCQNIWSTNRYSGKQWDPILRVFPHRRPLRSAVRSAKSSPTFPTEYQRLHGRGRRWKGWHCKEWRQIGHCSRLCRRIKIHNRLWNYRRCRKLWHVVSSLELRHVRCISDTGKVDGHILGFYECGRMPKLGSWALSKFSPVITRSYNVFPAVASALLGSLGAFLFLRYRDPWLELRPYLYRWSARRDSQKLRQR